MSGVRGPNSALTEFLRTQGINANEIRRRHERRRQREQDEDNSENGPEESSEQYVSPAIEASVNSEDPEVLRIAQAAAKKRRGDFGDLDDAQAANEGTTLCAFCKSRFTVTVYSKPAPNNNKDTFLCRNCSAKSVSEAKAAAKVKRGANKAAANKKRKKISAELLNLRLLKPPSLQDLCINLVVDRIDSIEEFGELTATSLNKISRILGKNRRLTPQTMQHFLRRDLTVLEFWDCSKLAPEAYNLIPAMCPNLEKLVLGMCGLLNDENIRRLAELPNLSVLQLDGPFLVRQEAWLDLFEARGHSLKELTISSVYRIDAEALAVMVENCASLEKLTLKNICQLYEASPFFLLGNLSKLRHLELCDLEPEAWSDECITHVLNMIGSQLEVLILKGAENTLGDATIEAIAASCSSLHNLQLVSLYEITEEAVIGLFTRWKTTNSNTGLQTLSLERCFKVGDEAIQEAINHSGPTLVELNLNSLKLVGPTSLESLSSLPNLTKLDIGFIGRVDPMHIYKLSTSRTLKQLLAFGNIRLSGMPLPTGLTVVGTM